MIKPYKQYFLLSLFSVIIVLCIGIYVNVAIDKPSINEVSDKYLYKAFLDDKTDHIGNDIATKIIDYRNANKPIKIDDLIIINMIGEKRLKSIKVKFKD